jgi:hypothetical protein
MAPLKNSLIERKIQDLPEKNVEDLVAVGFPKEIILAFLETAKTRETVLMSRDPNFACGQLIEEKYDLKGYHVKSKSCNWGPMAGFVCKLPPFNKIGIGKYEFNVKNTSHYLEELVEKNTKDEDLIPDVKERKNPWEHIKISEERRKNLLSNEGEWRTLRCNDYTPIISVNKTIGYYGFSIDKSATVQMEWLMLKEGDGSLWGLYHGKIQIKDKKDTAFRKYDFANDSFQLDVKLSKSNNVYLDIITSQGKKLEPSPSINFKDQRKKFGSNPFINSNADFYEIQAITNPYPPIHKKIEGKKSTPNASTPGVLTYRNCVTGDFDLFAYWPFGNIDNGALVRGIEGSIFPSNNDKVFCVNLKAALNTSITKSAALISFLEKKRDLIAEHGMLWYALYLEFDGKANNSTVDFKENINIEFIPVNNQLLASENIHFGNIHPFGQYVAQTLNSIAASSGFGSNMALHNDEGGRPFIVEVDFPIGYFLPTELRLEENKFGVCGTIKNIDEFLDFIILVNKSPAKVYLNQGWFLDLLLNALSVAELKTLLNSFNSILQTKGTSSNIYCKDIKEKIENVTVKVKEKTKENFENYRQKITCEFLGFRAPMDTQFCTSDKFLVQFAEHFLGILIDLYLLKDRKLKSILNSFGKYTPDEKDFILSKKEDRTSEEI